MSKGKKDFSKLKTQQAYERYFAAQTQEEKDRAYRDLCIIAVYAVRSAGLHPPASTDSGAENWMHAHRRYKTNRFSWVEVWIAEQLANPPEGDNGPYLIRRCVWRLTDLIRASRPRPERNPPKRVDRSRHLPSREGLIQIVQFMDPPKNEILRDLWERIVAAYPEWRFATNRYLASVLGVHHNVIASRRAALAAWMHNIASETQSRVLTQALRLRIGRVRKTDVHKVEQDTGVLTREALVSVPQIVGYTRIMDWKTSMGKDQGFGPEPEGTPQLEPIFRPLERIHPIRQPRCAFRDPVTGVDCIYAQSACPFPAHKPTI